MKKIIYTLALVVALVSCNPETLDDIYSNIDISNKKDISYTLKATDYTAIATAVRNNSVGKGGDTVMIAGYVGTFASLNHIANAPEYVPDVLARTFPALREGSAIQVSYAYMEDYVVNLNLAKTRILNMDDYRVAWGEGSTMNFLTSENNPASKLPEILAVDFPTAVAGNVVQATYRYTDNDLNAQSISVNEYFEDYDSNGAMVKWDQNGWTQVTPNGSLKIWSVRNFENRTYAQVSANDIGNEVTDVYSISPVIDLSQRESNILSFDVCVGYWNYPGLSILVTEDANCLTAPESVVWTDVTSEFYIPSLPTSGYGEFLPAGAFDLNEKWAGKEIYIAFRYYGERGTGNTYTTTYQIDNVLVAEFAPVTEKALYGFDGSTWSQVENSMALSPADYVDLGIYSFSADDVKSLLPKYLGNKYPYAKEGEKIALVYRTNTAAIAYVAVEYVFTNNIWQPSSTGSLKTEQFIHTGEGGWKFDPTVNYTMVKEDYQLVVTAVLSDPILSVYKNGTYTDSEWYYGFAAYYSNVNFRLHGSESSSRDIDVSELYDIELHSLATDEEKIELLWTRLKEEGMPLYLTLKYPTAQVEVQGVPQIYNIRLAVFHPDGVTNETHNFVMTYKVLSDGAPGVAPIFEYVSMVNETKPDMVF